MKLLRYVVLKYKRNKEFLERTHLNDAEALRDSAECFFSEADSLKHTNRTESIRLVKKGIKIFQRIKILLKNSVDNHSKLDIELKIIDGRIGDMRNFLVNFSEDELDSSLSGNYGDKYFEKARVLFEKAKKDKNLRRVESIKNSYGALDNLSKAYGYYIDEASADNVLKQDMVNKMKSDIEKFLEWFGDEEKNKFVVKNFR